MDGKPTEGILTVYGLDWSKDDWVETFEIPEVCSLNCTRNVYDPNKPSLMLTGTDALKSWSDARVSLSFANTKSPEDIAKAVSTVTGMRAIINPQAILPKIPRTYACKWSDAMKTVFGKSWTVQNQTVYCGYNDTSVKIEEPHEISATTTVLTQDGKLRSSTDVLILFEPSIKIGCKTSGVITGRVEAIKHRISQSSRTTQLTIITERKHVV